MRVMKRGTKVQNSSWSPCAPSSISSSSGGANPSCKRRLRSVCGRMSIKYLFFEDFEPVKSLLVTTTSSQHNFSSFFSLHMSLLFLRHSPFPHYIILQCLRLIQQKLKQRLPELFVPQMLYVALTVHF